MNDKLYTFGLLYETDTDDVKYIAIMDGDGVGTRVYQYKLMNSEDKTLK